MGLFGRSTPKTPVQDQAARTRGDAERLARQRRDRELADKYEARVEKRRAKR